MNKKDSKNNLYLLGIIIFFIGVNIFNFLTRMVGDDYWWHIKAGEYMVENKLIPFTDVFSWFGVQEGLYWHSHEWLTEVVLYLIQKPFGDFGVYIFTLLLCVLLQIFILWVNKDTILKNKLMTIVWIILGSFILEPVVFPRPHMISFLLLAITLYLLFNFIKNENDKKIWLLPIISILWVNFHGGSSNLPYVLTFIFLFVGLFEFEIGKLECKRLTKKQLTTLFIVGILSIVSLVVNPHGIDMITYPYANMNDSFMLSFIAEWRSPDLKNSVDLFIYVLFFIIGITLVFTNKKLKAIDLTLILAFTYLTCKSVRFSVFLYMIATFVLFKYINEFKLKDKYEKYLGLILIMIGIALSSNIMNINLIKEKPILAPLTMDMIEEVKELNPKKLYNDYNLGGYLIYNDIPVFVDSRADMYSKYNLKDAINLMYLQDTEKVSNENEFDVNSIIEKYGFDAFLIQKVRPLNQYLKYNNKYEVVDEDKYTILYQLKE